MKPKYIFNTSKVSSYGKEKVVFGVISKANIGIVIFQLDIFFRRNKKEVKGALI
jgi:hypothetical protein